MPLPWIQALIAANKSIIACERRFHDQCILVAELATAGRVTAKEEMLLASYLTSLALIRTHRDNLLADVPADEIST